MFCKRLNMHKKMGVTFLWPIVPKDQLHPLHCMAVSPGKENDMMPVDLRILIGPWPFSKVA